MSLILVTREDLENQSLAHYRTPGSKNGERRYQYEDGSLTPLGRIHYGVGQVKKAAADEVKGFLKSRASKTYTEQAGVKAEINKARSERHKEKAEQYTRENNAEKANEHISKAAQFDERYKKYKERESRLKEQDAKNERTNAEIKKDVESKIKAFNEKTQSSAKERIAEVKAEKKQRMDAIREIRTLADMELNKRIDRLQRERTYAELINDRANYEKSPLKAKTAKILSGFAESFAKKALNQYGDEVLKKLMDKGKNGDSKGKPKDSKSSDSSKPGSGSGGGKFSSGDKAKIRSMAAAGKSIADIASSLGVSEDKVKGFMKSAGLTIK